MYFTPRIQLTFSVLEAGVHLNAPKTHIQDLAALTPLLPVMVRQQVEYTMLFFCLKYVACRTHRRWSLLFQAEHSQDVRCFSDARDARVLDDVDAPRVQNH